MNYYLDLEIMIFMVVSWSILVPIDSIVVGIIVYLRAIMMQRKFLSMHFLPFFSSTTDHFVFFSFINSS